MQQAIIRDPYLPPTVDGAPLEIHQFASTGLWKKSDYFPFTPLTKVTWFQLARGPGERQEEAQVHVPQP